MRCVFIGLLCVLLCGCGAMQYQNGEKKMMIVKFGLDTTLESAKYMDKSEKGEESIEITGMTETSRMEMLQKALEFIDKR